MLSDLHYRKGDKKVEQEKSTFDNMDNIYCSICVFSDHISRRAAVVYAVPCRAHVIFGVYILFKVEEKS